MSGGKFHYSLEPVLKTRKWERDALQADLMKVNDSLQAIRDEIQGIQRAMASASSEWNAQAGQFAVDRFAVITNYMQDLTARCQLKEKSAAELEVKRDELINLVAASQRGVEAVERHRDQKKAEFTKMQLSDECKIADDQWSTLKSHERSHDN